MTRIVSLRAFLFKTVFASVFLAAVTGFGQSQPKIATIDLTKVFEGYYKTKQADAVLETHGTEAQKTYTDLLNDLKKGSDEYKKLVEGANDQAVSAEEREKRKKAAESKLLELREIEKSITQFKNEATARLQEQKRRLRDGILAQLREVIDNKARAGGYTLVLDISAKAGMSDTPVVLFSSGQNDLTEEVLKEINATAPPGVLDGSAPPAAQKAPVDLPKLDEQPASGRRGR